MKPGPRQGCRSKNKSGPRETDAVEFSAPEKGACALSRGFFVAEMVPFHLRLCATLCPHSDEFGYGRLLRGKVNREFHSRSAGAYPCTRVCGRVCMLSEFFPLSRQCSALSRMVGAPAPENSIRFMHAGETQRIPGNGKFRRAPVAEMVTFRPEPLRDSLSEF